MNIYERINQVRSKVAYVQKTKFVQGGNYKAVTHDEVTGEIRNALIDCGVIIIPSVETCEVKDTGTRTAKDVPFIRVEAIYKVAFVSADSSDNPNSFEMRVYAHAIDQGDKAPGKAISYATKYAILKVFNIETGEDEEARPEDRAYGAKPESAKTVAKVAFEGLPVKEQNLLTDLAVSMRDLIKDGNVKGALEVQERADLDTEQQAALWSLFDKEHKAAIKAAAKKAKEERMPA